MNNIEQYRKRFYGLMESTMGDVKPLINEQKVPTNLGPAGTGVEKSASGAKYQVWCTNTSDNLENKYSYTEEPCYVYNITNNPPSMVDGEIEQSDKSQSAAIERAQTFAQTK